MSEEIMTVDITSQHIVINRDRSVAVPSLIKKSIVQRDHNIERLTFDCPRYWYGKDISTLNIYINYISTNQKSKEKDPGSSLCENVVIDENDHDMLHFDWIITNNVSEYMGGLIFLVCAKSVDSDGNEDIHWNSHLCKEMEVQEGLEASSAIVKRYPDVIESILSKLGKQIELRNSGTAIQYRNAGENTWVDLVQLEDIKGDAAVIVESNFKGSDTTENILAKTGETGDKWYSTDEGVYYMINSFGEWINCGSGENLKKIEDEISELKGDIEQLKQSGGGGSGTGLSTEEKTLMLSLFKATVYDNSEMQATVEALEHKWTGSGSGEEAVYYTITNNLTNVSNSNSVGAVAENTSYSATLTADSGYDLESVIVTMGGTDITATAYADGVISIDAVMGNIVITASATATQEARTVYFASDDSIVKNAGYMRTNGTIVLTTNARYKVAELPYAEGMLIHTYCNPAAINDYPPFIFFDGANYTVPEYTTPTSCNYEITLSGQTGIEKVYVNMFGTTNGVFDDAKFYYVTQ